MLWKSVSLWTTPNWGYLGRKIAVCSGGI